MDATKREMLQVARFQATSNQTINGLWITKTRKHEVIQATRVQETNSLWEWLSSNASKLRDLALAGAAGTYAIGFIVWSIHALRNDLGLLSVLDSQYIIAGIIPILIISLSVASVYFIMRRIPVDPRLRWAFNSYKNLFLIIGFTLGFITLLDNLLPFLGFRFNIVDRYVFPFFYSFTASLTSWWEILVISLLGYVVVILLMVAQEIATPSEGIGRFVGLFGYPIFTLVYLIWNLSIYVSWVYPNIPYSLGGPAPRCAYLDVDISKISADSKSTLFNANGDTSTISRSDAVDVYHAGDNWVLVKKAPADPREPDTAEKAPTTELKDSTTYEIDRDAINAIIWC